MTMGGGTVSKDIAEQVLSVLPTALPGLTYAEIHERVDMWSRITIKHAVRQLREEGLIDRWGNENHAMFTKVMIDSGPR
jgi:hypothetical protein